MVDPILYLKFDGDDFEIVGHDYPDSVGAKRAGQQAAVPSQPEASDALLSETGTEASLEALERLLGERKEELRERLQAYLDAHQKLYDWMRPGVVRIGEAETLSHDGDTYEVRLQFEMFFDGSGNGRFRGWALTETKYLTVFLKLDGEDFEIVGHNAELSSNGPSARGQPLKRERAALFRETRPAGGEAP